MLLRTTISSALLVFAPITLPVVALLPCKRHVQHKYPRLLRLNASKRVYVRLSAAMEVMTEAHRRVAPLTSCWSQELLHVECCFLLFRCHARFALQALSIISLSCNARRSSAERVAVSHFCTNRSLPRWLFSMASPRLRRFPFNDSISPNESLGHRSI